MDRMPGWSQEHSFLLFSYTPFWGFCDKVHFIDEETEANGVK